MFVHTCGITFHMFYKDTLTLLGYLTINGFINNDDVGMKIKISIN